MNKSSTSLNGWWGFIPEFATPSPTPPEEIPADTRFLVPSYWNKHPGGVRLPEEPRARAFRGERGPGQASAIAAFGEEAEFLFDNFDYPIEWAGTRNAWIGRSFRFDHVGEDDSIILEFDAVSPRCEVFVNGSRVAQNDDPCLPFSADITRYLERENSLWVHVLDHDYDKAGRTLSPSGNEFANGFSGIWQDVRLVRRGAVRIEDLSIRTSVRRSIIELEWVILNTTDRSRPICLTPSLKGDGAFALEPVDLELAPGESKTIRSEYRWTNPRLWSPEDPHLYTLESSLSNGSGPIDSQSERFGFREVWIEGRDVMLNSVPIRLFSDWGHKASACHLTEGWIRAWFGMIRDGNMNHSRLHSHPHPRLFLDLADECGILITNETGFFGAGGAQAADSPEYWVRAEDHVRRFVKRDKNHPSVILWSVENEMRWNRDQSGLTVRKLPEMRRLFERLDPTRPAYHDGDSSLWNERRQPMISRHYGKECTGLGWWDGLVPLHSGELSLYHYAGPNNTVHQGGDAVWAHYDVIDVAAATDTALIVEDGRSNGVVCFGPWNISCHQNLRIHDEYRPEYDTFESPGIKPLRIAARTSEFEYWKNESQYHPKASFDIQSHAFRPFACIDRSRRTGHVSGTAFSRRIYVVNDHPFGIAGALVVSATIGTDTVERRFAMALGPGEIRSQSCVLPLPDDQGDLEYRVSFVDGSGAHLEQWKRIINVQPSRFRVGPADDIAVYGRGAVAHALVDTGASLIESLDDAPSAKVLVVEANALTGTVAEKRSIRAFAALGGRIVMLEQRASLLASMPCEGKIVQTAFCRAPGHPILDGITDEDLRYWGDDAYGDPYGQSLVARVLYRKDGLARVRCIVDSGEGNFGDGDLEYLALFEAEVGDGLLIGCQLRVHETFGLVPAADRLLANMLQRARSYRPTEERRPIRIIEQAPEQLESVLSEASKGTTVFFDRPSDEALKEISRILSSEISLMPLSSPCYQIVRAESVDANDGAPGVSNWDTCGIETYCYSPAAPEDNTIVATNSLKGDTIEPLFVTPSDSFATELFVEGGSTELLRSHTVSTAMTEQHDPKTVVGVVSHGAGKIIISCFAPKSSTRPRFERMMNQLWLYEGGAPPESSLEGDRIPTRSDASDGHPTSVYRFESKDALPDSMIEDMRERTIQGFERMASTAMLEIDGWERVEAKGGAIAPGAHVVCYYTIHTPISRTDVESNLDIPNPEALTNLELSGDGAVSLVVNGVQYPEQRVDEGGAVFTDIGLERGFNYVLIFRSEGTVPLTQQWRTTMRKPETSFRFG